MVGGQVDDMATTEGVVGDQATVEVLRSIHARKTGALMRACLRLGGLAGGAGSEELRALDGYGQKIGLAFQIADDLLDVCGAESVTGKRVAKDDGRGKRTFPGVVGVDKSRQLARDLCRGACEQLGPLGSRADRLKELAQFIVERDR